MPTTLATNPSRLGKVAVEDSLLGLKTSAAFLASLSSNLRLDSSSPHPTPMSSPGLPPLPEIRAHVKASPLKLVISSLSAAAITTTSTVVTRSPTSVPIRSHRRRDSPPKHEQPPPPSPSQLLELEQLPPPTPHAAHLTQDPAAIASAQELLSSSVARQSTVALRALCFHPLNILALLTLVFLSERCIRAAFRRLSDDPRAMVHLWTGITLVWATLLSLMTAIFLIRVRLPYQTAARSITSAWLAGDEVLVVHAPQACTEGTCSTGVLGMLLLEYRVRESQVSKGKKRRFGRGLVRGWAVAPGAQSAGLGTALLREAARTVAARGGEGLWFAEGHAHAARVLPAVYGGGAFDRRDRAAQRRLAEIAEGIWGASLPGCGGTCTAGGGGSGGGGTGKRARATSFR